MGAKGDWDFRISDLIKNPDGTDIYRRAQLAKSSFLISSLVHRTFSSLAKLQPRFLSLQW